MAMVGIGVTIRTGVTISRSTTMYGTTTTSTSTTTVLSGIVLSGIMDLVTIAGVLVGVCIRYKAGTKVGIRTAFILTITFGTTVAGPIIGAVHGTRLQCGAATVGDLAMSINLITRSM